jgi:NAD(P)-dependent dehydrogenase (short-subunit alcohol dehydrogenase family)
MVAYSSVLITGASSGLGAALARALAAPGTVLHLSGRDPARLEAAAAACRALGAEVRAVSLDVRDAAATAAWIADAGRLDLVVANAGISAGSGGAGGSESEAQIRAILATNLDGMLNTVLPALRVMAAQPRAADGWRGHIAAVASLAGFVPIPGAPSYSASKAAVDTWMLAAAPPAARNGIALSSICPGYIRTPMTDANPYPMPGLMSPDQAARIILHGLARRKRRIAFPWWFAPLVRAFGLLPPRLSGALLGLAPDKPAL